MSFSVLLAHANREDRLHLSFWLRNATYYLDYATFCTVFGFAHEHILDKQPKNARVSELWPKIVGRLIYPNRNIYAFDVHHPILRIFFKFSRETLFPFPSPLLVQNQEVHILHRLLAPYVDTKISIPMTLWKFLNTTATLDVNTELCVGGHVYRIAEFLDMINPVEFSDRFGSQTTLHEQCLVRAGFIYTDPLRWRYLKDRTIPLPSHHLPPLL